MPAKATLALGLSAFFFLVAFFGGVVFLTFVGLFGFFSVFLGVVFLLVFVFGRVVDFVVDREAVFFFVFLDLVGFFFDFDFDFGLGFEITFLERVFDVDFRAFLFFITPPT